MGSNAAALQGRARTHHGRLHGVVLIAAYLLVVLLPLIIALVADAPGRSGLGDLASAIGMVGFTALLLEFAFSGRLPWLTDRVGMDALMRFHQFSGYVVLLALLAHPYLYALFGDSTPAARVGDAGGSAWAGVTGFIAWFALIGLVFSAIFRDQLPITYERWRLMHGLGAGAIAILGLVHTLGSGTAAEAPALRIFWWAAVGLALLTLVHVYAIKPALRRRYPWQVKRVTALGEAIHELELEPVEHAGLRFRAGQFAWLRVAEHPWGLREHPFSIASAPGDGAALRFIIKANGDATSRIGEIEPGARAWIDGPYGRFGPPREDDDALLFIAGGVGLAPVLSLLRDRAARGDPRPMCLVYACRWRSDMILDSELDALAGSLDLRIVRVVDEADRPATAEPGPVDAALLRRCLPDVAGDRIGCFVCAPPGMIDAMETSLVELGLSPARIVSERFRYRFGAASPLARRTRRIYLGVAVLLLLGAVAFAVLA